jgi:uncharacterized membrane protein YoaK (UPF0700 family)
VVTGLVDAVSYLALGHVFVANMTGNVVILGFAIAGAKEFSIAASLAALIFFALGSTFGGLLNSRIGTNRGRLLSTAAAIKVVLVVVAGVFAAAGGQSLPVNGFRRFAMIGFLAVAMGLQNAVVRKLAVPDLTTTVLTLTTTGIFADAKFVGGPGSKVGRRGVSILAMFLGALAGALLVLHVAVWVAVVPPALILLAAAVVIRSAGRTAPPWTHPAG